MMMKKMLFVPRQTSTMSTRTRTRTRTNNVVSSFSSFSSSSSFSTWMIQQQQQQQQQQQSHHHCYVPSNKTCRRWMSSSSNGSSSSSSSSSSSAAIGNNTNTTTVFTTSTTNNDNNNNNNNDNDNDDNNDRLDDTDNNSSSNNNDNNNNTSSSSTWKKNTQSNDYQSALRISKTLARHVWPSSASPTSTSTSTSLLQQQQQQQQHDQSLKQRVLFSIGLMLTGKAVTIQIPYIFKLLVDSLPLVLLENQQQLLLQQPPSGQVVTIPTTATLDLWTTMIDTTAITTTVIPTTMTIPLVTILLAYGMSRATASGLQEWRNAVFAHVAQDAIRHVGKNVFQHVHTLDLQFHLNKNTGKISRILDRGNRSISFVLNAMIFHIVPTTVEVALVTSLVGYQFGTGHATVVLATITSYLIFTVAITQWRTQFRRDMNRLENQATARVVDSLVNYETVQYCNNVTHEV
jgi:putative effector of murein hydrolase LrgA (UPF0299 family)